MKILVGILSCMLVCLAADDGAPQPGKDGWVSMFDGKTLDGWKANQNAQSWSVKDGAIVGTAPAEGLKFNTFLCSKKKYGDFELKFKVRLKDGIGNSGVQIRSKMFHRIKLSVAGPQCDIVASYWGSLLPAVWSFMLAARARGLGSAWTTLHLPFERDAAELLGIPYDRFTQAGLFPVAYTIGTDFRPAPRVALEHIVHFDSW